MSKKIRTYATGGGNATASGVNFQQSLGAVVATWMLTETAIDQRLLLGASHLTFIYAIDPSGADRAALAFLHVGIAPVFRALQPLSHR